MTLSTQTIEIYNDEKLSLGLNQYPSTRGHILVVLKDQESLISLENANFVQVFLKIKSLVPTICAHFGARRCALVTEGNHILSLLPLHGLSKEWTHISSNLKEFYETYPGYITSKDGPRMADERLDKICGKLRSASGFMKPTFRRFGAKIEERDPFSLLVQSQLSSWPIWQDARHVAFLTPFANTPGFTVIVPRKRFSSDIFSIKPKAYAELMRAAHTVAQLLKTTLEVERCGMLLEGFDINYAHLKLIPIIPSHDANTGKSQSLVKTTPFQERYQGYVSSLDGPQLADMGKLKGDALRLREYFCRHPTDR